METIQPANIDVFEALVSAYQRQIQDMRGAALAEAMRRAGVDTQPVEQPAGAASESAHVAEDPVPAVQSTLPAAFRVVRVANGRENVIEVRSNPDGSLRLSKEVRWPKGDAKRKTISRELVPRFLEVYVPMEETACPKAQAREAEPS